MGGMLDRLFDFTGVTGTQWLTAVVGGFVLAVLARLVQSWYRSRFRRLPLPAHLHDAVRAIGRGVRIFHSQSANFPAAD
jgi:hypothetical protein